MRKLQSTRTVAGLVVIALATVALATAAHAQEPSAEEMAVYEKYAMPGEAHALLTPMVGAWDETVLFWPAPGAEPMEMRATSVAAWTLGGRWLRQEHRGQMFGQPFEGVGLLGYDSYAEEYVSIWIDNHSTGAMITRGAHDPADNTINMSGTVDDFMADRENVEVRTVHHWKDPDTSVYEMYVEGPGGEEFKTMQVTATRVASE